METSAGTSGLYGKNRWIGPNLDPLKPTLNGFEKQQPAIKAGCSVLIEELF
jgi:hypothetical protein